MTATDELRRLLYERGVEYEVRTETNTGIEHVIWHPNEFSQWDWNEELGSGWLSGWQEGMTPRQAVDATIGRGECRRVMDSIDPFNTWVCDHCGRPLDASDNFCGGCGRRVKQ